MDIRNLMAACVFTFGVFSVPAAPSFAAPASAEDPERVCNASGYLWIDGKCANKSCYYQGKTYGPGSQGFVVKAGPHKGKVTYCDGTTGQWKYSAITSAPGTSLGLKTTGAFRRP
jgi:hypothetical protein